MSLNTITDRYSNRIEKTTLGGVVVGGLTTLGATIEYGIVGGMSVMIPLAIGGYYAQKFVIRFFHNRLLAELYSVKEPIFIVQENEMDRTVFIRAEKYRALLKESKNILYEQKKIEVVEIYMKDVTIDFCETQEEYMIRVEDFKKDYLRRWAKNIGKLSTEWTKQNLYNQYMSVPGRESFFERQFPLLSTIFKSKEAVK